MNCVKRVAKLLKNKELQPSCIIKVCSAAHGLIDWMRELIAFKLGNVVEILFGDFQAPKKVAINSDKNKEVKNARFNKNEWSIDHAHSKMLMAISA